MKLTTGIVLTAISAAVLTACGGGGGSDDTAVAEKLACTWDTSVKLSFEERRLETPLPFSGEFVVGADQTPFAKRILQATGFDGFAPDFAKSLCDDTGKTTLANYDELLESVKKSGTVLWRAAVDRVQGKREMKTSETMPRSEDRMLYWARTEMTKVLRQFSPEWGLTAQQMETLQWEFEKASRGQTDIDFPEGDKVRRMLVSGFDVFTLGTPGTPNTGLRNGNPSGATALEMDGREITLSDGTKMHVEAYILPVSYDPFTKGMQEDTIGPWMKPGPKRVDASITMSQGGKNIFWLEEYNGRFHGSSAGNDGKVYCPVGTRLPQVMLPLGTLTTDGADPITEVGSGCNTVVQSRWYGSETGAQWKKNDPPQFTKATLPHEKMLLANTQRGVTRPLGVTSEGTEGFDVTWHTNYNYFPDCASTVTATQAWHGTVNKMPDPSTVKDPDPAWCSRSGGGGDYLSNESAYRNTLMRDMQGLTIPAGHIHIPVMNYYFDGKAENGGGVRDDNAISDVKYEGYRTAIVGQGRNLLTVIGESLVK